MRAPLNAFLKLSCAAAALSGAFLLFTQGPMQAKVLAELWGLNQLHYFQFKDKLKARAMPALDKRFTFSTGESFLSVPTVSLPSGFYEEPMTAVLSSEDSRGVIYYSLDGRIPTTHSHRYEKPIDVEKTMVLRARSIESGYLPSEIVTRTYFVNEDIQLPVFSIIADPVSLWNPYSGIDYHAKKRGRRWERNAVVEYFDDTHALSRSSPAALRIHGGYSRWFPKKSFRVAYRTAGIESSRSNVGARTKNLKSEETIILRQGGNGSKIRLRDELFQTLYSEIGGLSSSFTPSVLFINGRTWGIYNIRERINLEFLRDRSGQGNYDLIADDWTAKSGGTEHWNRMLQFFRTHDLSRDSEFAKVSELIDVHNVTDYWLMNIYAANRDWPTQNTYAFRKHDAEDSRWKWISWDADQTFDYEGEGLTHNTLAWAIRDRVRDDLMHRGWKDSDRDVQVTLVVRSLLRNDGYRKKFVRRFCDLLNVYLLPSMVEGTLNQIIDMSRHDLPLDWERWSISEQEYWNDVDVIRTFANKRPKIIREYFQKEFGLGPDVEIQLFNKPMNGGTIQINTVETGTNPWSGSYFQGETVVLRAKPSPGFRFVGWTDPQFGSAHELSLGLQGDLSLGAVYKPTH